MAAASGGGKIKPERSWRDAASPSVPAAAAAAAASATTAGDGGSARGKGGAEATAGAGAGEGGAVWPSGREEGRHGGMYKDYDRLLDSTADHGGEEWREDGCGGRPPPLAFCGIYPSTLRRCSGRKSSKFARPPKKKYPAERAHFTCGQLQLLTGNQTAELNHAPCGACENVGGTRQQR